MRICMLIWGYWPDLEGGAQRQCRKIVGRLSMLGHECTVLTNWSSVSLPRNQTDEGGHIARRGLLCPIHEMVFRLKENVKSSINYGSMVRPEKQGVSRKGYAWVVMVPLVWLARFSFISAVILYLLLNRRKIDVLHVHESNWIAGVGVFAGEMFGLPVICKEATFPSLGELDSGVPFRRLLNRERKRSWFIAQHEAARKDLADKGINSHRIFVVPNGVNIPREAADVAGNNQVLCVGNFTQGTAWKGFDILIRAWGLVIRECPGSMLVLVGRGYPGEWVEMARSLGCLDSIEFVGWQDDVESFYRQAAFLVLPSRVEGMSNVLLEAQGFGLPAVVSDIPGNLSVVINGETGIVAENGNEHEFADGIIRLLKDSDLRKKMGAGAREHTIANYDMDHVIGLLIKGYQYVLATSGDRIK